MVQDLMFLSKGHRDLRFAFQTHPGSQASCRRAQHCLHSRAHRAIMVGVEPLVCGQPWCYPLKWTDLPARSLIIISPTDSWLYVHLPLPSSVSFGFTLRTTVTSCLETQLETTTQKENWENDTETSLLLSLFSWLSSSLARRHRHSFAIIHSGYSQADGRVQSSREKTHRSKRLQDESVRWNCIKVIGSLFNI